MDALPTFFDDALLEDYDEAMEVVPAEAAKVAPVMTPAPTPTPAPTTTTPASNISSTVVAPPTIVPPPVSTSTPKLPVPAGNPASNVAAKNIALDRSNLQCRVCSGKHPLRSCSTFRRSSHARKLRLVLLHHYCSRCLAHTHQAKHCLSTAKCRHCDGNHNSILHAPPSSKSGSKTSSTVRSSSTKKTVLKGPVKSGLKVTHNSVRVNLTPSVSPVCPLPVRHVVTFSPTLIVQLQLLKKTIPIRAALDLCCSISYICETLVHNLRLPVSIMDNIKYCRLTVGSSYDASQRIAITAKVAKMKGVNTPSESVSDVVKEHFAGFQLADPSFNVSGRVALVLGPELSPQVLKGKIHSSPGLPLAQYTMFGWVISGQSPL